MAHPAKRKSSYQTAERQRKARRALSPRPDGTSDSFSDDSSEEPGGFPDDFHESPDGFETIIIHRVKCSQQKHHVDHPEQADFHDIPRLFIGDSKASELRGEKRLSKSQQDETRELVWIKIYSCDTYHELIEPQFETLRAPRHPKSALISRYFHVLNSEGPDAEPEFEEIKILASDLQEEIRLRTEILSSRISTGNRSDHNDLVVDRLYTCLRRDIEPPEPVSPRLDLLLRTIEEAFRQEYSEADSFFSREYLSQKHLPKLFRPNDIIVRSTDGHPRAYVIERWPEWDGDSLLLPCTTWSFDGRFYKESKELYLTWDSESKEVPITELSLYPLRFDSQTEARLLARGSAFWQCRNQRFVSYTPSRPALQTQTPKPRYMIDSKTYQHVHSTTDLTGRDYLPEDTHAVETPPSVEFQLLLPATIPGFGFHDKKWINLLVEQIQEIEWNAEAFKHLVLKSTKKELIEALVDKHTAASDSNDVIQGKGNGLILLLHGGPGTGKTLTAESVAELTCKPLYRVTCGDIGTNAEDVERYLESVLYLGTIWQCVVLLDEADVFLEERTQQDLQRNALVSVFLRVLEYYSGILVLTSNRIGTFDEAFKSRVQLTLHYPTLDESSRRRIWSNFISRLQNTVPETKADQIMENLDELARFKLNGREIRNSIRTALLLAEFRGERLQYRHLVDVIDVSNEFEQYLQGVHGHTASEWAMSQKFRRD
ncbi:P-loop containing nucleoside triphosphate hydrolase protein [Aspergillus insuetus]